MAKISVVVPVYKVELYLRRCVDSILAQTYRDFELILVDDGSPDRCGAICDEYAKRDDRVVVLHRENGGVSSARNAGLDWVDAHSSCEYIALLDSDDWIFPNYLEELLHGCELSGGIASVECQEVASEADQKDVGEVEWQVMKPREYWLAAVFPMTPWGKLYPREAFDGMRYPVGYYHEDERFTHHVLFKVSAVAYAKARLYCYFRYPGSFMGLGGHLIDKIGARKDQEAFFAALGDSELVTLSQTRLCRSYAVAILHGHPEYRQELRRLMRALKLPILNARDEYHAAYFWPGRVCWTLVHIWDVFRRRGLVDSVRQFKKSGNL